MTSKGAYTAKGVAAAKKQFRRDVFSKMSRADKHRLYHEVLRNEQLSSYDKKVLLAYRGFTTSTRPTIERYNADRDNDLTTGALDARVILITYNSPKLLLKVEDLDNPGDAELVEKLVKMPAMRSD